MCVNDVLAQGAEPLVFLDYLAQGRSEPQKIEAIVAGVADGRRQAMRWWAVRPPKCRGMYVEATSPRHDSRAS